MTDSWVNHRGHEITSVEDEVRHYKVVGFDESTEEWDGRDELVITVVLNQSDTGTLMDTKYIEYWCETCNLILPDDEFVTRDWRETV